MYWKCEFHSHHKHSCSLHQYLKCGFDHLKTGKGLVRAISFYRTLSPPYYLKIRLAYRLIKATCDTRNICIHFAYCGFCYNLRLLKSAFR